MQTRTKKPTKRVTAAEIAKRAGVAKSTVSLAFSAPNRVSADTRDRILEIARKAGYTPNPLAQSLKTGRNNVIGLVLQDLTNPHGGTVLKHVQETANGVGYMVMTATADSNPEADLQYIRKLEQLSVPAAIIMPSGSHEEYVQTLIESPVRFITYGHKLSALNCDHVGLDNRLAIKILVRHLVELGHRRIGHIAGNQEISSGRERLQGMRESMAAAGLTLEEQYIGHGVYDEHMSYRAALKILADENRPTALVASNNVSAIGALRAARDVNLRCPEDISIATVDALPWADLMSPQVTCAAQPIDEMAKTAASWIIESLESNSSGNPPRLTEFAPQLIVGQSTKRLS